jgi:uncharacterized membrane protein YqjE
MKTAPLTSPQSPYNSEIPREGNAAESLTHAALSHRLAPPLLKYLECRGQLLSLEGREAMQHAIYLDARLAIGDLSLLTSWVFLTTALFGALTYFFDFSWVTAVAITGVGHLLFALAAGLSVRNRLTAATWFTDSINELQKDRLWLKTQTMKNSSIGS